MTALKWIYFGFIVTLSPWLCAPRRLDVASMGGGEEDIVPSRGGGEDTATSMGGGERTVTTMRGREDALAGKPTAIDEVVKCLGDACISMPPVGGLDSACVRERVQEIITCLAQAWMTGWAPQNRPDANTVLSKGFNPPERTIPLSEGFNPPEDDSMTDGGED